ncbi:hypothetical protein [Paenibacillus sp. JCM 10914]
MPAIIGSADMRELAHTDKLTAISTDPFQKTVEKGRPRALLARS